VITYTWNISQLNCVPQAPEGADYVVTAHWSCNGVDGDYSGSVYNTCGFAGAGRELHPVCRSDARSSAGLVLG